MELEQLHSFNLIIQEQNFSKAAVKKFITQPAISMQIKGLEKEIGFPLFDRSSKKVHLTEAGKILQKYADRIFREVENAKIEIESLSKTVRGKLSIGCSDTVSSYLLPTIVTEYMHQYPDVEITVQNQSTQPIIKMIHEQEVDIGFITMPVSDPELLIEPFTTYDDIAVFSKPLQLDKEITLETLSKEQLILLKEGTKNRRLIDKAFKKFSLTPQSILDFGSVEVQKAFAKTGAGVAIVPNFSVKDEIARKELDYASIPQLTTREIAVVFRQNRKLPLAAEMFMRLVKGREE